jgi:uncharacterized protein YoxC
MALLKSKTVKGIEGNYWKIIKWFNRNMETKKRIECLEKDLDVLQKNLQRIVQQQNQLEQQKQQAIQKIIELNGQIKERQMDLID